jgi:enoyl-CoA hydratase
VLLTEVDNDVATITLNRPEVRNALSPELIAALHAAVSELDGLDLAAMILTGADPAFCAGVDLKRLSGGDTSAMVERREYWGALPAHRTPIIGAVNGATVTGGFELALSCDFLVASDRARFADTHARVGVMPGWGLTVRLPALIGIDRARRMSLTGDYIDAKVAYEWGLVTEVVPHDDLLPRAREIASHIATVPRANVRSIRAIYAEIDGLVGEEAWATESERSYQWMRAGFDQGRLAAEREAIIERGRGSL